jgi:hypothetical protein
MISREVRFGRLKRRTVFFEFGEMAERDTVRSARVGVFLTVLKKRDNCRLELCNAMSV